MKASVAAELLLLLAIGAVAYLLYVQQRQLTDVELELDRVRGAIGGLVPPVPPADPAPRLEPKAEPPV